MAKSPKIQTSVADIIETPKLTSQQIGRLGELLVQYELLQHGIDSAPMTTDAGVDLVAYSELQGRSFTIQVKSNLKPKPAGGKGTAAIDWWVNEDCPAELFAFAEVSSRRVWLFTKEELARKAQQRSSGRLHLYMYIDSESRAFSTNGDSLFSEYLFANRVSAIFS